MFNIEERQAHPSRHVGVFVTTTKPQPESMAETLSQRYVVMQQGCISHFRIHVI